MIDYEEDDDRTFVIEGAIKHSLGSKEEIELYNELSLVMELMEDDGFNVVNSGIGGGIEFGITTRFPHPLPEKVGIMFFNVGSEFDVSIKETSQCVYAGERYYAVSIKKDQKFVTN
jgi:hypothetical protein